MSNTIIRVENLGKKYIIGHQQEGRSKYVALRDVIAEGAKSVVKRFTKPQESNPNREEFWALKDVSFEIKQGECVGIIGRNGAGKSTLLKILSRITEPTTGRISIKGRVASLLEVGTGFHPELTGRENIYLNGAILGMSRTEIKKKFDEIVAFAEVEKFLDTPVKRYSSGMYVRLAFAVAAHLEPEILVVDEVLAVGDAAFQKKCLGKMGDVATKEGRTVLFVSHDMGAIEHLCQYAMVLQQGCLLLSDITSKAINYYLKNNYKETNKNIKLRKDRQGKGDIIVFNVGLINIDNESILMTTVGSKLSIVIDYFAKDIVKNLQVIIGVYDFLNTGIMRFDTEVTGGLKRQLPAQGKIICHTEEINLIPGEYNLNIAIFQNGVLEDYIKNAFTFQLEMSDFFKTGKCVDCTLSKILVNHSWQVIANELQSNDFTQ
ncbi:ABC transporter, ATP-binding protein [Stanieria sp. NIES-3757]|nr:ABC transporter, ATP-binding protein [Stanieria sp. NIES-3757]